MTISEKKQNDFIVKLSVVVSAALLVILISQNFFFSIEPLKQLELKLIDRSFIERGRIDLGDSSDVVIIEITQSSYDQIPQPYNKWPWPRSIFAHVIKNLTDAGVKAIGIDIDMPGPDQFSSKNDSLLHDEIIKSGRVVVAGKVNPKLEDQIEKRRSNIVKINEDYDNIFYDADSSLGIVQPPPDNDFVFRRYLPYILSGVTEKKIPSFGFALLNKYYNLKNNTVAERENNYFKLGDKLIPQFDKYSMLIDFYGPSYTFPHYQLIDILDDKEFKTVDEIELDEELNTWDDPDGLLHSGKLKNKIAIIGSTMPEDRDLFPVSYANGTQKGDNLLYGVEFHANVVQNIIRNDYLYKQPKWSEIVIIILFTILGFYFTSFLRKIKYKIGFILEAINILIVITVIYFLYKGMIFLFINNHLVVSIIGPSLAIVIGYFSSTAYHFISERKQNVLIIGMFGQYVSKNVVNELLADPDKLKLGGEKKNLTILFSDIAGFTTFSEKKKPEELVKFINEFLTEMSEVIIENEGTLDKYLGDAVMAFWGAPLEVKDHAVKACKAALLMQDKLVQLRKKWTSKGEAPIYIRIGINSGDVIVGNIGGTKRFDYTVLGDAVNLASRLEGANKEYATNIMIGDSTYKLVKDKFIVRELDIIKVKGKSEPTTVYELISSIGDKKAEEAFEQMDLYLQGLELYRLKSFDAAHDYFKRSFEKLNDFPSKVYMNRCEFYIANPPVEDWDGVFEMKTK